jgi:hypothetical protein
MIDQFDTSNAPDTLDAFRRCSTPGCEVQVRFSSPIRCFQHGGPPLPQVLYGDDGEPLREWFMPNVGGDDLD